MINWDDLRPLLAVARFGTLAAAAKTLKINATTVGRRVQSAEAALGARLFDRVDGQYVPTKLGEAVRRRAEAVEQEILALEGEVAGKDQSLEGVVRVTSVSVIINCLLVPCLPRLLSRHPNLGIEFFASDDNLSLTRREADMALRLGRPRGGRERTRKIGTLDYGVYASEGWAADPDALPWLAYDETLNFTPEASWLAQNLGGASRALVRANELEALFRLVLAGSGRALLPLVMAEPDPRVRCLSGPRPVVSQEIWLVVHPELRKTARVSAVIDWILEVCTAKLAEFDDGRGH